MNFKKTLCGFIIGISIIIPGISGSMVAISMNLYNDLIYNSTVILSNLGSIKCGAIYHNLTNFGTNSIIATIGEIHKEQIITKDGKKEIRDVCDFGINVDERIADGVYFAKSLNLLQYIFDNPELLDDKASEIVNEK